MHKITKEQAVNYIQSNWDEIFYSNFNTFAFRGDSFVPVKKFRKSRYHGDDIPKFQLPGVSAIKVMTQSHNHIMEAMKCAAPYGNNLFLLLGTSINANPEYHDPGEILLTDHTIIAIII